MKKRSMILKRIGLALAGLGAAAISSGALADIAIQTDGGLKIFDPVNNTYWVSVGGRLEIDQIMFSGSSRDNHRHFPNGANIRRGYLALEGGVGDDWEYNLTFDFGRTTHRRLERRNRVARLNRLNNNNRGFQDFRHRRDITHGVTFFEEAWIGYTGLWDCSRIRFGQFTPIATMDGYANYGTTNGQMFLESALATRAFSVPSYINSSSTSMKGLGIILETQLADLFTAAATVYEPAHGVDFNYGNPRRSDRVGGAVRFTFSPIHEETCAFHMGVMARYQTLHSYNGNRTFNGNRYVLNGAYNELFFTTPEVVPRNYVGVFESNNAALSNIPVHGTHGSPVLVDAGPFRAKSYNHFAGELAGVWGPVTLQGEYHYANVQRRPRERVNLPFTPRAAGVYRDRRHDRGNVDFHGWHAQGGYVLTGESRYYDFATGTIGGISPANPCGAWELVARYSYVTLNDKNVRGGSEQNVTAGLNWYVNDNVRFAFNYIRANIRPTHFGRAGARRFDNRRLLLNPSHHHKNHHRNLDIFALRAQVVF